MCFGAAAAGLAPSLTPEPAPLAAPATTPAASWEDGTGATAGDDEDGKDAAADGIGGVGVFATGSDWTADNDEDGVAVGVADVFSVLVPPSSVVIVGVASCGIGGGGGRATSFAATGAVPLEPATTLPDETVDRACVIIELLSDAAIVLAAPSLSIVAAVVTFPTDAGGPSIVSCLLPTDAATPLVAFIFPVTCGVCAVFVPEPLSETFSAPAPAPVPILVPAIRGSLVAVCSCCFAAGRDDDDEELVSGAADEGEGAFFGVWLAAVPLAASLPVPLEIQRSV